MKKINSVLKDVEKIISKIIKNDKIKKIKFSNDISLVGERGMFDSMNLVELCINLEDLSLNDNFNFDWTSDKAMSDFNSNFKTPKSIANEYMRQLKLKK